MEQLLRRVTAELDSFDYLIFDFKRVLQIDDCAAALLNETAEMLRSRSKKFLLAHLRNNDADRFSSGRKETCALRIWPNLDSALEWCEERVLRQRRAEPLTENCPTPLDAIDILAGFDPKIVADSVDRCRKILSSRRNDCSRRGPGGLFVSDRQGTVSVCLKIEPGARRQRLSSIGPGLSFGELALLDGGVRSADVIAEEATSCYVISIAKIKELAKVHPEIQTKLIFNISQELAARLRHADAEIRSLAE